MHTVIWNQIFLSFRNNFQRDIFIPIVGTFRNNFHRDISISIVGTFTNNLQRDISIPIAGTFSNNFQWDISIPIAGTFRNDFQRDISISIVGALKDTTIPVQSGTGDNNDEGVTPYSTISEMESHYRVMFYVILRITFRDMVLPLGRGCSWYIRILLSWGTVILRIWFQLTYNNML